ncbi:MAG: hypothetical protein H6696_05080 [Deferribacteres bacterium]|nr:hypothetical protein [candidate division KSB1 bacterium]MCB9501290.1 hypothetical protein [Deferribacteres bacterium]
MVDSHAQAQQNRMQLNLRDVSLSNSLEMLVDRLGKNLLLDAAVPELKLNMSLENITPMEAFLAILEANGLAYKTLKGGVFYVAPAEKIGRSMELRSITCKYAKAPDLEKILKTMVASESGAVMADERTNTLLLRESPETVKKMIQLIETLDRPTKQVYIQAEIVEISSTDGSEFGFEWIVQRSKNGIEGEIKNDVNLGSMQQGVEENLTDVSLIPSIIPFPVGSGLGIGIFNNNTQVLLKALADYNNLNLLSRPRIMAMDNEEATITVGDQIPFRVLNQFGVTSFEFKDATVELVVKPHIIDSTYMTLEVSPKADFQNGYTPDGTPIISTRKATTNVKIHNGQTIVIGGLIRDSFVKSEKKIPLLGDIPLLGYLFKKSITSKQKTELIVFIQPIIMKDDIEAKVFEDDFKIKAKAQNKVN